MKKQDYQKEFKERALALFKEANGRKAFVQKLRETHGTPDFDRLIAGYMYYNQIDFKFYQLFMWSAMVCDIFDIDEEKERD